MRYDFQIKRRSTNINGDDFLLIKYHCFVIIKDKRKVTQIHEAKLDTAAPISLIPPKIWQEAAVQVIPSIPKELSQIETPSGSLLGYQIGFIELILFDARGRLSQVLKIPAILSNQKRKNDYIILGQAGFLEKYMLQLDQREGFAFLDDC